MPFGRRRFLMLSLGAAGAWPLWNHMGRSGAPGPRADVVRRESWALGSRVEFVILGLGLEAANRAIDAALDELETIEQVMSLYRPESQLSRLNADGVLDQPHPYLVEVLHAAERTARLTDGAFDITVQPVWQLFADCQRSGRFPTDAEIAAARSRIDWRGVRTTSERISFASPWIAVTLNGIAQGFATDCVRALLESHGVEHALVNAGEFRPLGQKPDGAPWTIGIRHPRHAEELVSRAVLDGRAVATSGDYETTFSADFAHHHIFDPRTGDSPAELASATLIAPTAMEADALSTTAMVLGTERTLEMVRGCSEVDALLIDKTGRIVMTPGFPSSAST